VTIVAALPWEEVPCVINHPARDLRQKRSSFLS
jgi:hypothetical protein